MTDATGHGPTSTPPPPPPPPPVVVEIRTVSSGGSDVWRAVMPVSRDRRGNSDPVADGQPPGGLVGECDRCGRSASQLVSWRVALGNPPEVSLRGLCAACATEEPD